MSLRKNMILRGAALLGLALLVTGAAAGQYRRQQASKGPRAIGVIEFDAKGKARLVPVTIFAEGRWWDAGLYKATPVPMALEPETVYEATNNGEPVGLFTVTEPATLNGTWLAMGRWREGAEEPPKKEARVAAKPPSPEDERPTLRRPNAERKSETPPPEQKTEAPPKAAPAEPAKPAAEPEPAHPVLRRGQVSEEQARKLPGDVSGPLAPAKPVTGSDADRAAAVKRVLVAVSDEKNNEYRAFTFHWKPEEQTKITKQMADLATAELNAYASLHPGPRPAQLQDVQVRTFDLELINEPTLVIIAKAGEAPPAPLTPVTARGRRGVPVPPPMPAPQPVANGVEFYVAAVARQDFNGDLHKLFSTVTDSKHLDAYPRLELIDAVDADGNGRGELLFRDINDRGRTFILYRVGADQLSALYDGSSRMTY